ncbi:MAG: hypothetical protein LBK59_09990, partial [Bifidobacteriaceae bacterium]|nr:hypothetical protein [Bifidobacteriaceae bacterium]
MTSHSSPTHAHPRRAAFGAALVALALTAASIPTPALAYPPGPTTPPTPAYCLSILGYPGVTTLAAVRDGLDCAKDVDTSLYTTSSVGTPEMVNEETYYGYIGMAEGYFANGLAELMLTATAGMVYNALAALELRGDTS